jgi:hypothetical protein
MAPSKKQRLEQAVAFLQGRYGARVVQTGNAQAPRVPPPGVATGFPALDTITGCGGLPLGAITLLTGQTTSGKLTLAYKALAQAQHARTPSSRRELQRGSPRNPPGSPVAILDLTHSSDPDYLARCGIGLEDLLLARPQSTEQALTLLGDMLRSYPLRMLLVDSLADLAADRASTQYFDALLPQLGMLLARTPCALVFLDEPRPPWLRWLGMRSSAIAHTAALHVELKRETWLEKEGELYGYRAQAQVIKSRWARSLQKAPVEIHFNGTVKARTTW